MKKQIKSEKREPHVLDDIPIDNQGSKEWKDRVKRWYQPMSYEDRISWLHTNVVRGNENGPEQFIFFLEVADSYGVLKHFHKNPGVGTIQRLLYGYQTVEWQKSMIAKKAFALLCAEFFTEKEEQKSQYPITIPFEDPLFSKLLWFFRPGIDGGAGGWDNLRPRHTEGLGKDGGSHYIKIANQMAATFAMKAWQMLNGYWYILSDHKPDKKVAEPHLREIVALMQRLGLLDCIYSGQYVPTRDVFLKMVAIVLEEDMKFPSPSEYKHGSQSVGPLLEKSVEQGNALAQALYIARFEVDKMDARRKKDPYCLI